MECGRNFITKAKASSNELAGHPQPHVEENLEELDEYDVREIDPRVYQMQGLAVDITNTEKKPITFGDLFPQDEKKEDKQKEN